MKLESITNLRSISFNYTYLYKFDKALKTIFEALNIAKSLKMQDDIIDILLQIHQV